MHYYERAAKIDKEDGAVRVAHLLNVIGKDAQDLYETFNLAEDDQKDISKVLEAFEARCIPAANVIYERYMFNRRVQDASESVDHYITDVMKLAEHCQYGDLRDDLIRDKLVSGIRDDSVREKLLGIKDLSLTKAIETLRANQAMKFRVRDMASGTADDPTAGSTVNAVRQKKPRDRDLRDKATKDKKNARNPSPVTQMCKFCGKKHEFKRGLCPAAEKKCKKCGKKGHFAIVCLSTKTVHIVEEECSEEETYSISTVKGSSATQAMATCRVNDQHDVAFEIDTGASCNILPLSECVKATGDKSGLDIKQTNTRLTMHNNTSECPLGRVMLSVSRNGRKHRLRFFVVNANVTPILGRDSSIGMKLVQIMDSDTIHKVSESSGLPAKLTQDGVLKEFTDIFEGLGELEGEYIIHTNPDIPPVVHPPRKLPISMHDTVKKELDAMVENKVIAPVTEPTQWVSSMVVVQKRNNKIRICLDPKDLNRAIMRSHYPLPTVEQVATRLSNAKIFTVLDAKTGFWQVQLDQKSSYLTTFNTPFGRYRWLRMPFGISSAPEVWQQRMNQIVEGLQSVEVIADDFLVCGIGNTTEEALANHDLNLRAFLNRAREKGLKLNPTKVKLRCSSVPFIGHLLTDKGLAPNPEKTAAIVNMPTPTNVRALQEFLGMVQYLSKFLPSLSKVTEPLRQLEHKNTEWCWLETHDKAISKLKQMICEAPVLKYFDPNKSVTVQCDASEGGLGYSLLQEGQPVAYGARALTSAEKNYAQIEKEMLGILVGCEKFDQYIFGRKVKIETDHKPLVSITKKPIHSAPKRLQRMLLRLQKYDLELQYKKGKEMYIADALSRAYPKDLIVTSDSQSELCHQIEEMVLSQHLPFSVETLSQFRDETARDPSLQVLMRIVLMGWPEHKKDVPLETHPYFNSRDELSVQNGLLFKGERVIIPVNLRQDVIQQIHHSHLGIEGSLCRAREAFYWPLMNAEIKDAISKCTICNTLKLEQCQEPLRPHEVPDRPWSKVGTDLFTFKNQTYIVAVDYYSNFIEMDRLRESSSKTTIKALKTYFSRHGVPDVVVSDNGPQYSSEEFRCFSQEWKFKHITSSPRYPQSNGKAESAVKTCKTLLKKAELARTDVYLSLLDHRNTPTEQTGLSPAQRLFCRRTRTLLPMSTKLLQPETQPAIKDKLLLSQDKQASYYNKVSRPLPAIQPGDVVRFKLPGKDTWTKALCKRQIAPRSYTVECNGKTYRRNRKHLRHTPETLEPASGDKTDSDYSIPMEEQPVVHPQVTNVPEANLPSNDLTNETTKTTAHGRVVKAPKRLIEEL